MLHDVFAVPFDEGAEVVGRSPEAASRVRQRVRGASSGPDLDLNRRRQVVEVFLRAARSGDMDALLRLLDPAVVLRPDGAALSMGGLRETRGATAVARALAGGAHARVALLDGVAGFVWAPGGHVRGAVEIRVLDGVIVDWT